MSLHLTEIADNQPSSAGAEKACRSQSAGHRGTARQTTMVSGSWNWHRRAAPNGRRGIARPIPRCNFLIPAVGGIKAVLPPKRARPRSPCPPRHPQGSGPILSPTVAISCTKRRSIHRIHKAVVIQTRWAAAPPAVLGAQRARRPLAASFTVNAARQVLLRLA